MGKGIENFKDTNSRNLERVKTQGKKIKGFGFLRILFGRTAIVVVSIGLQIYAFYLLLTTAMDYSQYINLALSIIAFVIFVSIVNSNQNPNFKIAWIAPMIVLPVFGSFFYLYCETDFGKRRLIKKAQRIEDTALRQLKIDETTQQRLQQDNPDDAGLMKYCLNTVKAPAYSCEYAKFFPSGEEKIPRLVEELKQAERFIFLEYFIIFEGSVWDEVLAVLKEKAKAGVEVRVLYDGTSSLTRLPMGYFKKLRAMGIEARAFAPVRPVMSTYQNNRDHRKIVVIDGKVAFFGGINLADEYANRIDRFGYWKDTGAMVAGKSVAEFTFLFLKMWTIAGKEPDLADSELGKYLFDEKNRLGEPDKVRLSDTYQPNENGFIIPFGDNPYDDHLVGRTVYMDILDHAKHYVHIMTPYLILDDEMINSLIYAAERGVEVIIIMPHIPDKKLIYSVARTYYKNLIRHGVKIYEFLPGFVHAKEFIADDVRSTCGTINLDYRSFYLHFEDAVYFSHMKIVADMERDFQETLEKCEEITLEKAGQYPKFYKLTGVLLRIIAPLL